MGPTGTGKTELAKNRWQNFLFQDENAIIRFDMSEFKEEHSAALLWSASRYVGYEEGGLLVNKIRQKPYSIVLSLMKLRRLMLRFSMYSSKLWTKENYTTDLEKKVIFPMPLFYLPPISGRIYCRILGKGEIPPSSNYWK